MSEFALLQAGFDAGLAGDVAQPQVERALRMRWQAGFKCGRESASVLQPLMDEHAHQVLLFRWAQAMAVLEPGLELMYAVPNSGKRTPFTAARMKAEGLKPGVPDVCLPLPRGGFAALYIEMKAKETRGRVSAQQHWWLDALRGAGNQAQVCHSWLQARQVVCDYLSGVRAA